MHYPIIDPIIVAVGPIAVRWYGLAYLAAFLAAWGLGNYQADRSTTWTRQQVSDLVFYGALGAVLGGRIGYVLFYGFEQLLVDPLWLLRIWDGGMSFHGGMAGVTVAAWWFARRTGRTFLEVGDFTVPLVPLGLGFGRLGNFANTELPGRATDSPLGLVYPCDADAIRRINALCTGEWEEFARHPSPLYQAFAEGIVLFVLVWFAARYFEARHAIPGRTSGVIFLGYGVLRFITEFFRQPDAHLGYLAFDWLTMGQVLSVPLMLIGLYLLMRSPSPSAKGARA